MTQEDLARQIAEFDSLIESTLTLLERYVPKTVIEKIRSNADDAEHDKLVSFETKVECAWEFFRVEGERIEKKMKDLVSKKE